LFGMGLDFTKQNTTEVYKEMASLSTRTRKEMLNSTYPALYVVMYSILEGNTRERTWIDQHKKTIHITKENHRSVQNYIGGLENVRAISLKDQERFTSPWAHKMVDEEKFERTIALVGRLLRDDLQLQALYHMLVMMTPSPRTHPDVQVSFDQNCLPFLHSITQQPPDHGLVIVVVWWLLWSGGCTTNTRPQQPPDHNKHQTTTTTRPQQPPDHDNDHTTTTTRPQQPPDHNNHQTTSCGLVVVVAQQPAHPHQSDPVLVKIQVKLCQLIYRYLTNASAEAPPSPGPGEDAGSSIMQLASHEESAGLSPDQKTRLLISLLDTLHDCAEIMLFRSVCV